MPRGPRRAMADRDAQHVRTGDDSTVTYGSTAKYRISHRFPEDFWLTYFAFDPTGVVYADDIPGGVGFGARQRLVEVSDGRLKVLWQAPKATPS